jgi:hypothetical protein
MVRTHVGQWKYRYDDDGRVLHEDSDPAAGDDMDQLEIDYAYDGRHRLISEVARDASGRVQREIRIMYLLHGQCVVLVRRFYATVTAMWMEQLVRCWNLIHTYAKARFYCEQLPFEGEVDSARHLRVQRRHRDGTGCALMAHMQ